MTTDNVLAACRACGGYELRARVTTYDPSGAIDWRYYCGYHIPEGAEPLRGGSWDEPLAHLILVAAAPVLTPTA